MLRSDTDTAIIPWCLHLSLLKEVFVASYCLQATLVTDTEVDLEWQHTQEAENSVPLTLPLHLSLSMPLRANVFLSLALLSNSLQECFELSNSGKPLWASQPGSCYVLREMLWSATETALRQLSASSYAWGQTELGGLLLPPPLCVVATKDTKSGFLNACYCIWKRVTPIQAWDFSYTKSLPLVNIPISVTNSRKRC